MWVLLGSRCGSSFDSVAKCFRCSSGFGEYRSTSSLVKIDLVGQCGAEITEGIAVFLGHGGLSKGSLLHRSSTFQLPTAAGCVL
jgi:hypothetical protein